MSSWRYEVQAAVHSGIRDAFLASNVDFFLQKFFVLFIDVFGYGLPARNTKGKKCTVLHVDSYVRVHENLKQQIKTPDAVFSMFNTVKLLALKQSTV